MMAVCVHKCLMKQLEHSSKIVLLTNINTQLAYLRNQQDLKFNSAAERGLTIWQEKGHRRPLYLGVLTG